jgi:hypothetical protein
MDNVQNCDNYINIPSSQTFSYFKVFLGNSSPFDLEERQYRNERPETS